MKKIISFLILVNLFFCLSAAELTARFVTGEAVKKDSLEESLSYLKDQVAKMNLPAEKRATYVFIATLEEQMALYDQAQKSYAQAASIAAGDAEGMPKKSNEEIVLDAIRCALSSGDYMTADSYLNSAVRNTRNQKIQAYIKLYTQWSALCRAEKVDDIQEPLVMLQAYLKLDSMECLRPAIYLTLWYLTGDKSYSQQLASKYPKSPEAAIVKGDVQLLPTPFWFFVPKSGEAEQGTGSYADTPSSSGTSSSAANETSSSQGQSAASSKTTKWQLGLFKTQSNAKLLVDELKSKGFEAYTTSETRASGTTYYIVLVNEDKSGNMADKLRNAGYDCYAVD
ncbi:MAG: SPOR domain-containing protein [Treponema sp.]|nr:SPOR domain-containing protein [Treponema sp.]MCI7567708.1 SPOR domain-containing protein [Treponema sp.]